MHQGTVHEAIDLGDSQTLLSLTSFSLEAIASETGHEESARLSHIAMFKMARQDAAKPDRRLTRGTEFQLHSDDRPPNVIDYTERRLMYLAENVTDQQQKLVLMALIIDYRSGRVAISWRGGRPVPLRVTSEG